MNIERAKAYVSQLLSGDNTNHLKYHNLTHTLNVCHHARIIGIEEGLDENQLLLVETAALFHDTGYIVQYENNEPESIRIARAVLPEMGFSPESIVSITGMIEATEPRTKPRTIPEAVLCDADYAYLGEKDCAVKANLLYEELLENGYHYGDQQWLGIQIRFLENHRYFTQAAQRLYEQGRRSYLNRLKEVSKNRSTK